ncbi:heterodisulfide reductase-related iron-sulfur binding cluster [Rhodopirellula halodulae]|uniref:heterodisulfide reductase-related iron-sulfur binding cluster n=1 Tax=Rhodopirellula halodulae TaxID=2894198 RepID=UPI001E4ECAC5|nr:heterodisulfide reductase-related iron-sulfur binding cluster [Rhodopirellula sp. JC737]MCC9655968.1 4Fe-4S dicluster domain-containing protein [Rhodopirellula sp. JC737]
MQHEIPIATSGPNADSMSEAVNTCIRCGFCLSACPTYDVLQRESDTPRGRIILMKEVLEGSMPAEQAAPHLDACLGCLACEPACPSGVSYRHLLSPYRALVHDRVRTAWPQRLRRWLAAQTLPYPGRFRLAAKLGIMTRSLVKLVPSSLRPMLELLPSELPSRSTLQPSYPALGESVGRVALLAGCAQQVLAPQINDATIAVLTHIGLEVIVPPEQGCCGSLTWHVGDGKRASAFARHNIAAFLAREQTFDAIVTNAAGCGSGMQEYEMILRGTDMETRAAEFASLVRDVSLVVSEHADRLRLRRPPSLRDGESMLRVAYQDACHLANAQGVRLQPRELLCRIPGVELVDVSESHLCCGSAGTYNIDQPEVASELGRRKAKAVLATGAPVVVSGNIGCLTQLQTHLQQSASAGHPVPRVMHTMEFLRECLDD